MVRDKKKATQLSAPEVYDYHDYRVYLSDFLSYLKKEKKISARKLSKDVGISHGYLSLVVKNKRNLSGNVLSQLAPVLKLTPQEESYLKSMIELADSSNPNVKNKAFKKIKNHYKYKEKHSQELGTYKYLENWLHVAIRELAQTANFSVDPQWIMSMIPVSVRAAEIEKSLEFLLKNNFLKKDEEGNVTVTEKDIACLGGVFQLSLGNFHREMLSKAQEALTLHGKQQRKQVGYTMAIAEKDFNEVKDIIEEAKEKIKALEKKSKSKKDTVYHVNFSAFPLAGEGAK